MRLTRHTPSVATSWPPDGCPRLDNLMAGPAQSQKMKLQPRLHESWCTRQKKTSTHNPKWTCLMRAEPTANVGAEKLLDHFDWDELYLARCQVLSSLAKKKTGHQADMEQHTCERAGFDDVKWRCIDLHALFAESPRISQPTLPQQRHVFCRQAPIEK